MRTFLQYVNLPQLTSSDVIINATLSLWNHGGNGVTTTVEAHRVNSTWDSQTITWANQPSHDNKVEDYAVIGSTGRYYWEITALAQDWYTDVNTGLMLKTPDSTETGGANNWKKYYSVDYDVWDSNTWPYLYIIFRNTNGLESYWDYTAHSAGRAGTGYVNNYSGNLVWVHNDIGFGGNRMPVSISHIYNANDSQSNTFGMGNGWRINYNQAVYLYAENNNYYVWDDSDGTKHYFLKESEGVYKDEDNLNLTLTTIASGAAKYKIVDQYGNASYFDTYGRLAKIENSQITNSSISITYQGSDSQLISKIIDGAGRVYDFTYSNGLLTRISYKGNGSTEIAYVSFGYTEGNLVSVTYKDGEQVQYRYSGNYLTNCTDIDGYALQYSYSSTEPRRVTGIQEFAGTTGGGSLTLQYAHNQTTLTDHNGNANILQFNDWGNAISVQDGEGRAQYTQYAINDYKETEEGKANQLTLSSKLQNTVNNQLMSSSFENNNFWNGNCSAITVERSSQMAYIGNYSLKVTCAETAGDTGVYGTNVTVKPGETITLSAYVKTIGTPVRLGFHCNNSAGYNFLIYGDLHEQLPDWERIHVSYTNDTTATLQMTPYLFCLGTGTLYMDCVQAEIAPTPSRYNLLQNGDFTAVGYWSTSAGRTSLATGETAAAPHLDCYAYKFNGSPTAASTISQTVYVNGGEGDTFILAGWAKGDSVPLNDENRKFGLRLKFNYTDGTTSESNISFNPATGSENEWQFASVPAAAKRAYSSVTVYLEYSYNANTAYFDGIQLFKEEFGSSYTYDDKGNVISVVDLQKQKTEYEYDANNNLTKIIQNNKAKVTYTYDDYHNVKTATTYEGIVYEFGYDTYGNNNSVSIVNGDTKITSTATYTTDGNHLVSTTDALGKTTTYSYNADTGVLEWVKYPNDTDATRTEYTYDTMYRVATAAADIDANTTLSASYTYDNDLLTRLATGSTTYDFSYNSFSQRTGIQIGSRTLATYTYTDNQNRYVSQLVYGNQDMGQYNYDDLGRVILETYEDGSTVSYAYDNNGALATVTDSETGIKTTYYYDFTDRLMKYVESGTNYSHSVGYEYDALNNLTKLVETINGVKHTTEYNYDDDNRVVYIINGINDGTVDLEASRDYTYDNFGRITQRITKQNGTELLTETISYVGNSAQVASITTVSDGYSVTYSYTYDNNGNISTVSDGTYCTQYFYDTGNQLIRENNQEGTYTCTWIYDNAGNILSRTVYPYTTGELGQVQDSVAYTYGDSDWGDLLTAYDGSAIDYDAIGNPTNDGIWEYVWKQGRQLVSMYAEDVGGEANDITVDYTYNADGMRISKRVTKRNYLIHQHSYTATVVAPTCTEAGYTLHECVCGYSYQTDPVSKLGHVYFPIPNTDGSRLRCFRCGDETEKYIRPVEPGNPSDEIMSLRTVNDTDGEVRILDSTVVQEFSYVYNGGTLMQMVIETTVDDGAPVTETLSFSYDASGKPMNVIYNGTAYFYAVNLQGDVMAILDTDGEIVVSYDYDAWGNIRSVAGTMADTLGESNPLTYRSYVYDQETSFYYLQSRYYDPEVGRFINADVMISTGQGILGNNMFVYCLNNPIMFADSTGTRAQVWQVIFEDHDPGYIHRAVQAHIIFKNSIMGKELVLPGIGRADIYNPTTYEIWEIKHGGSTSEMKNERILSADSQVSRYVQGAKEKLNLSYQKGHAGAFDGNFILTCGSVSYYVTYDTPAAGVILYYIEQLKKPKPNAFAVYPSKEYSYAGKMAIFAFGVGGSALVACMFGMSSTNRGLQLGLAR